VELGVHQLWRVKDGRVAFYAVYPSRDAAVAAIEEQGGAAPTR
jgi:hypothetical protein